MGRKRNIEIVYPLGGLNRKSSFKSSPPYATNDCLNVRSRGTINGRERGGSRPGLILSHVDDLGSNVNLLSSMVISVTDNFTCFSDTFSGLSMAASWTAATWISTPSLPNVLNTFAKVDTELSEAGAVLDTLSIDTSESYVVEVLITPWAGGFHGKYRLYLRLDDTTPDIETDGIVIELTATAVTNSYTCSLHSYLGGEETYTFSNVVSVSTDLCVPSWLSAVVDGDTISVFWNGALLFETETIDAHTGVTCGFGMNCTNASGVCLVNVFRVQYYTTGTSPNLRSLLISGCGGSIFKEVTYGSIVESATTLSIRDDTYLLSCQSGQELFIADYGDLRVTGTDGSASGTSLDATSISNWTTLGISTLDDVVVISNGTGTVTDGTYKIQTVASGNLTLATNIGTGTCAYRIERAPKVYTPSTDAMVIMYATTGQVPTGCPLIARYCDRIVLAGHSVTPNAWYMSRVSDPLDWDFSQEDSQRAVIGSASSAGVPGDPITAIVPHSDDYLIIACRNSLWRLRGDPAYGGSLDALSRTVGIIGPKAWCWGPNGELIFLSLDGLYVLASGGDSFPQSVSRESLPNELLNINPDTITILMEYDIQSRGVYLFLTPISSNDCIHWFFDWQNKTFWPLSLDGDYEPTSICQYNAVTIEDSAVILGCRDGYLRKFSNYAETDCGTIFESYVLIGPIPLSSDGYRGKIISSDAILATNSGDVTWGLMPSNTYEGSIIADVYSTGTWVAGLNATVYPACSGQAFCLMLSNESGRKWEVESINATIESAGKRRLGIN